MALSIISIPGDGVTDTFNVSFALGILDRNSVTAWVTGEVDGGGNKVYRTITYLTDTMLKISGAKAGNGVMVVFTRTVSQTTLVVNYEDGDIMNETNLNTSQKQALMLVHQVLDGRFTAFIQNVSAGGFKITNLGTPTVGTDASTKAYVDSVVATGASNAAAAAASAAAALASANASAASAGASATSAASSLTYSNNSSTFATNSSTFATNSSNSATASANSATASQTSRLASETARDKAQEWSDKPEDVVVTGTSEYSAYHWSRKALAYATGSIATLIHGSTAMTVPAGNDEFAILDSTTSFSLKKILFSDLRTRIQAFILGNVAAFTAALSTTGLFTAGTGTTGVTTVNGISIEIGVGRTVDGPSFIDFHSQNPDPDYSARILRNTTLNGSFDLVNTGTGAINLTNGSGPVAITATGFTFGGSNVLTVANYAATLDSRYALKSALSTLSSAVALSGTATDITGIPAGTTQITVMGTSISYNAAGTPCIQLGSGGGITTTGYTGAVGNPVGAGAVAYSTAISLSYSAAADIGHCRIDLSLSDAATNTWHWTATTGLTSSGYVTIGSGRVALPGALDRVRVTTTSGTPSADSGSFVIRYS